METVFQNSGSCLQEDKEYPLLLLALINFHYIL